jgi:uncharacterized membrane protein HdeD (DUF308 family)
MAIPLEAAAAAMREAMRETVKRYSLWYLLQGILMVAAGVLALVYPLIASVAIVLLLGWILIVSGLFQGIGLIGARQVPHFWLQLISVVLSIIVGLLLLTVLFLWTALGYFDAKRHSAASIGVLYWHFITIVWVAVFFTFYIAPRLG